MVHVNELLGPVHNSHNVAIRRCKRKFKYAYIENIQPKLPALPLARGVWLHYCLQAQFLKWGLEDGTLLQVPESIKVDGVGEVVVDYDLTETMVNESGGYGTLVTEEGTIYPLSASGMLQLLIEQVWDKLFPAEREKYTEDGNDLPTAVKNILEEYFYAWKKKFNPRTFRVLLVEVEWKRDYKGVEFEGRSDYVIQFIESGRIICGDWKSTKSEPPPNYKFMESQLNLYPWGIAPMLVELGIPKDLVEKMGVEFDYLSTKLPTKPQQNKDGSLSKRKINTTRLTLTRALKEYGLRWSEEQIQEFLARNERDFYSCKPLPRNKKVVRQLLNENVSDTNIILEVMQSPELATRTVTRNCDWDCDFQELCMGELYGQNMSHLRKSSFEPRTNSHAGVVDNAED